MASYISYGFSVRSDTQYETEDELMIVTEANNSLTFRENRCSRILTKWKEHCQASGDNIHWTDNPGGTQTSGGANLPAPKPQQKASFYGRHSLSSKGHNLPHTKLPKKRARPESGDLLDFRSKTPWSPAEICENTVECKKILFPNNNEGKPHETYSGTHGHYIVSSIDDIYLPIVPAHDIELDTKENGSIAILGKGVYGFVIRGQLSEGNRQHDIVAKFFRADKNSLENVLDEARILHFLGDTGAVPRVYGILQSDQLSPRPILIQECFANGQDLYRFLESMPPRREWITASIAATEGLLRIHARGVLLNDIKPDNVLIDEACRVRYIDMGMASLNESFVYPPGPLLQNCHHLAPEIIRGEPTTKMSDVFSLGIVLQTIGECGDVPDLLATSRLMTCSDPLLRCSLSNVVTLLKSLDCDETLEH